MNKIKTFVLTVSEKFPSTHFRKGEETGFVEKILQKSKIHTIRKNYPLWKKRIEQIQKGEAILSIRVWTGAPYKSPQKEIIQLDQSSGMDMIRDVRERLEEFGLQINVKPIALNMDQIRMFNPPPNTQKKL